MGVLSPDGVGILSRKLTCGAESCVVLLAQLFVVGVFSGVRGREMEYSCSRLAGECGALFWPDVPGSLLPRGLTSSFKCCVRSLERLGEERKTFTEDERLLLLVLLLMASSKAVVRSLMTTRPCTSEDERRSDVSSSDDVASDDES
jgi:hypothetical protein